MYGNETIDIQLGSGALKDPLLDLVFPPRTSRDTLQLRTNGILIRQVGDVAGKKTGVSGLKFHANAAGDFTFSIDFDCKKLERRSPVGGKD